MKMIILSRDGVINHGSASLIKSVDEWTPIDGSLQAMGRLYQAGYTLVVATNQSGIARGLYDVQTLHAIHTKMGRMLEQYGGQVESIFFCPHGPDENCACRKPNDGLFRDIMARYQRNLDDVPAVGDALRDIQAARSAGAQPVLVKTGKGEETLHKADPKELQGVPVYNDLQELADAILAETDL